jgi:hypothetical protein
MEQESMQQSNVIWFFEEPLKWILRVQKMLLRQLRIMYKVKFEKTVLIQISVDMMVMECNSIPS